MIGSIVSEKCQELLGQKPNITIDYNTRLALSVVATEEKFSQVIATLPQEVKDTWELLCPPSLRDDGRLYIEMKPISLSEPVRDLAAEIDALKAGQDNIKKVLHFLLDK